MSALSNDISDATAFALDNVWLERGDNILLEGISLCVPKKPAIVTLIGPNGAGKSTLLRLLVGLMQPTTGSIIRPSLNKIGYMPQKWSLHPYLPLRVVDFLNLTPHATEDGREILKRLYGSDKLGACTAHHLSMGQRQQVLFAKALMKNADVLLLDEPTRGLDLENEHLFYECLRSLRAEGRTILMASHDLHMVFKESDQVISLNRSICCMGKPEQVKAHTQKQMRALQDFAIYQHHHEPRS